MLSEDIIAAGNKAMVHGKNPGPANYKNDE